MRNHCPLGKMSCIGRFRRNVLTLKQTVVLLLVFCLSDIADVFLQTLFSWYQEQWSRETLFWIWNLRGFVTIEGLNILIPFALSVPSEGGSQNSSSIEFYVRKPSVLVPRRPMVQQAFWKPPKLIYVQEYAGGPSSLNKNKQKDNCELSKEVCTKKRNEPPKKEIPVIEMEKGEVVMSIPNLRQEHKFPSILYCKVHQSYEVVG